MLTTPLNLLATLEHSLRPPIPRMVSLIERQLDSAPGVVNGGSAHVYALVKCFNLAALTEAMFGRAAMARRLCEAEIRWLERSAHLSANPGLMAFAFQPWVNLVRLDRAEGNLSSAVKRLDVLRSAWQTKYAALGDVTVSATDWASLLRQVDVLPQFLRFNWTHESLLCALRADEYSQIEAIAAELRDHGSAAELHNMVLESRLIAGRLGYRPSDAAVEQARSRATASMVGAVFAVRLAELQLGGGSVVSADASALDSAAKYLLGRRVGGWELAMLQAIVAVEWELNREAVVRWATTGYDAACRLGDEVFERWFADACARALEGQQVWKERIEESEERSWHSAIRRSEHQDDKARCATLERISTRLLDIAEQRVGACQVRPDTAQRGFHYPPIERGSAIAPVLVQGIRPELDDPTRGTAILRFSTRRIDSLGPVIDKDTPETVRSRIESWDFAGQATFAAKPYPAAIRTATSVTAYVLARMARQCRLLFHDDFDENDLEVTIRVDRKDAYLQRQAAHIDWCKGTDFDPGDWEGDAPSRAAGNTFRALENCHSIDCILGGPPTEYFVEEQVGILRLRQEGGTPWKIQAIDFPSPGLPQPGLTGEILYRPPYTIHQFPPATRWQRNNPLRLFISFDYRL